MSPGPIVLWVILHTMYNRCVSVYMCITFQCRNHNICCLDTYMCPVTSDPVWWSCLQWVRPMTRSVWWSCSLGWSPSSAAAVRPTSPSRKSSFCSGRRSLWVPSLGGSRGGVGWAVVGAVMWRIFRGYCHFGWGVSICAAAVATSPDLLYIDCFQISYLRQRRNSFCWTKGLISERDTQICIPACGILITIHMHIHTLMYI